MSHKYVQDPQDADDDYYNDMAKHIQDFFEPFEGKFLPDNCVELLGDSLKENFNLSDDQVADILLEVFKGLGGPEGEEDGFPWHLLGEGEGLSPFIFDGEGEDSSPF